MLQLVLQILQVKVRVPYEVARVRYVALTAPQGSGESRTAHAAESRAVK